MDRSELRDTPSDPVDAVAFHGTTAPLGGARAATGHRSVAAANLRDGRAPAIGWTALVAPGLHTFTDLLEWLQGGFSPLQLWLNYLAFLAVPVMMIGLWAAQRPASGRVGLAGAVAYGAAFIYFAHTTLRALEDATATYASLWEGLGPAYTAHGALMVASGVAFGWDVLRARVLPRWAAWSFLVGVLTNLALALLPLPELLQTFGTALRNVGLMGMGVALIAPVPPPQWGRLVAGVFAIYLAFDLTARTLGSLRGEWGLLIGVAVVGATVVVDRWHSGGSAGESLRRIGLGRPTARGVVLAVGIAAALLTTIPLAQWLGDASVGLAPRWLGMLPGLFAQAGVAEEVLFRGLLFGTIRRFEPRFTRAALLSGVPFVAVHLPLLFTLDVEVALLSIALSAVITFPFARLFELAGGTIWGAALVHAVIQGALKVATIDSPAMPFAVVWMLASATVPYLAFAVPARAHTRGVQAR